MSDAAIKVLKLIHSNAQTDMPFRIVEQCYEAEKKFLFEKDPTKPLGMLKQIVETYVDSESN